MEFFTESAPHARYQKPNDQSIQREATKSNVAYARQAAELDSVRLEPVNLAVWQRPSNEALLPVVHWLAKEPFEMEFKVDVKDVSTVLQNDISTPPELSTSQAHLIDDIQELAFLFSQYASTNSIRLMVESLHRVPCPKFHQDNVLLRLVCTYTGIGTEWLENSNVNPHPDCCGGSLVLDETRIKNLKPFEVALMKGKRWPGNKVGIFHRSPTLTSDQPRLVVKMDIAH